jgi:predicted transcriptional regulator
MDDGLYRHHLRISAAKFIRRFSQKTQMKNTRRQRIEAILLSLEDDSEEQRRLDLAAAASAEEGIRQGLEDMERGLSWPAEEVFETIREKDGIPR